MFDQLVYDILQIVFDKLDTVSQIRFKQINSFMHENLQITELLEEHNNNVTWHLSDEILYKYQYITKLRICVSEITDIDHMLNLRELYADSTSACVHIANRYYTRQKYTNGINNIHKLIHLTKLSIGNNRFISKISHITALQDLDVGGASSCIGQNEISKLNNTLVKLALANNPNITDINHLTNLEELYAGGTLTKLGDDGIRELRKIVRLYVLDNKKIKDINHLTELQILDAGGESSGLTQKGIMQNLKIVKLSTRCNPKIIDVNHLVNLRILDARNNNCGITQAGVDKLKNIQSIDARWNPKLQSKNIEINQMS